MSTTQPMEPPVLVDGPIRPIPSQALLDYELSYQGKGEGWCVMVEDIDHEYCRVVSFPFSAEIRPMLAWKPLLKPMMDRPVVNDVKMIRREIEDGRMVVRETRLVKVKGGGK